MHRNCTAINVFSIEWILIMGSLAISAVLASLSILASDHPVLASVALVPVFIVVRSCTPSPAAAFGFVWGCTLLAASISELGPSIPLTPATLLLVPLAPAASFWLGSLLAARIGFSPFVLAVNWMLLEASLILAGVLIPSNEIDVTWVSLFGSLPAPLLVGFCLAWVNAELLELAIQCKNSGSRARSARAQSPRVSSTAWQATRLSPVKYFLSGRSSRAPPCP
jgi:hypothetical protein